MMTKSIDAKDKSLREVLSNVQYSIDFYQRDYKWQTKQCEELVGDLTARFLESFKDFHVRSDVAQYPAYFLGSIVLSKKPEATFVVDGQQRLTTLTLLLIYLRNLQLASQMQQDPNIEALIQSTQFGRQNFNMNVEDRKVVIESLYKGVVPIDEPEDSSSANIVSRYKDIEESFPDSCKGQVLPFFLDWLIERVQLVEISAYSDDDAYTVFETMNDRGLSLNPADMLKGFLLSNVRDNEQRRQAEKVWTESVSKLQSLQSVDATQDFFRSWFRGRYAITYGTTGDDYERLGPEYHRWLRDNSSQIGLDHSNEFHEFLVKDVPLYAANYRTLRNNQISFDKNFVSEYCIGEARIDEAVLLMAVVSADDDSVTIAKKMHVMARFLDIFVYRRLWAGKNLTKPALKGTFISLAKDVRGRSLESLTARLYAELTKAGHDNFQTAPPVLTNASRGKVHRLLARLTSYVEEHGGSGLSPYPEVVVKTGKSRYDIEHIWPNKFAEYQSLFNDEAEFQDYRNRLGSLVLIPHSFNRSYQAMPTSRKIPMYGRSDHHLLVASLATATYENNPTFRRWLDDTGFRFEAYDNDSMEFNKAASDSRTSLYRELARAIWSPELLIIDSGLDADRIRELADDEREDLRPDTDGDRGPRTSINIQIVDLVRSGLLLAGDILSGRRPGVTNSSTAIVLDDGKIELENGDRYSAPSPAAMSLGLNVTINGWSFWIHDRSGKSLSQLRKEHLNRVAPEVAGDVLFDE